MNKLWLTSLLLAGLTSSISSIFLKWSRTSLPVDAGLADKFLSIAFISAIIFYAITIVLYAKALGSMEVSAAYPVMMGSGFAMLTIASHYVFGEPFQLSKWTGLALVLAGIYFLAREG